MKRSLIILSAATLLLAASPMFAQSAPADLAVSAKVNANCTISTLPVAFGVYDPLGANAATPAGDMGATGSVTITCTKGNGVEISLGPGLNNSSGRRMSGAGDFLSYELYQDGAHTTFWGTGADAMTIAGAPSKAARSFPVYGLLPGAQDVGAADYTDTVVATVTF